MLQETSNTKR